MKLLAGLAQKIVDEVTGILAEEVIVVDHSGMIIAASDQTRIGNFHEGALISVTKKAKITITKEDALRLKGVKSGINLPISFQNKIIGVIGITGEPREVNRFGELIQRMTELIIQEAHYHEKLDSKYRGLETFVYEWVHLQQIDEDFRERGEILGISMDIPRCCVLIEISQFKSNPMIEGETTRVLREFYSGENQDILVQWGSGRYVLLKAVQALQVEESLVTSLKSLQAVMQEKYGITIVIGIGTRVEESSLLHKSYTNSKKALRVAKKHDGLIFYDQLTLDVALAEITDETRQEVVEKVLGVLIGEPELLETLEVYLESDLSIKSTSQKLHIHINTLHYRLKRICELTGYSLKETDNVVMFYVAVSFWNEIR